LYVKKKKLQDVSFSKQRSSTSKLKVAKKRGIAIVKEILSPTKKWRKSIF